MPIFSDTVDSWDDEDDEFGKEPLDFPDEEWETEEELGEWDDGYLGDEWEY